MAAPVTFTPNQAGLRELAQSSEVGDRCVAVAEAGMSYAESISPVLTGNYRGGFRVRRTSVTVPGLGRVAGAELVNVSPHAHLVEDHNGDHVLKRTAAWLEQADGSGVRVRF
ncbi:HK97 gp10 family phage protein [Serinicoccus sediminis]|uniref:HK97 gp10 family phage protein n=1 Tax=Serinicoccus sediminis TaxID=2306021 RepID=UPI00102092E3|nr:HK97 gp10 family phage protein [Serinicoccus sediminis]